MNTQLEDGSHIVLHPTGGFLLRDTVQDGACVQQVRGSV